MTKCAAFWKHTNIRGDNRVFPCCRYKAPVTTFKGSLEDVLQSEEYVKLRNTDVSTLWECSKCMYEEKNGKESLRQRMNKEYDTDTVGLEYLEIGFDNICNLTCDGCWSEFSSAWAKKETGVAKYTSVDEIETVPDTVKKVLFLGGEPLMTKRHQQFLEKINNPKQVEVIYNTNGTFLLKDDVIELLEKFKDNVADNYMQDFDRYYKPAFTYKALNKLIQGSAADMTKKAMVDLYEQGILPQIQIHDELCLSIKNNNDALVVKQTMENAISLEVKNKVNYKKGPNWGTIK